MMKSRKYSILENCSSTARLGKAIRDVLPQALKRELM
jgi:hypothetical protein